MAKISRFRPSVDLSGRRPVKIDLPEFLLRAIEHRIAELNAGDGAVVQITVGDVIEHELADSLSIVEVARLERDLPGITAAVSRWIANAAD